MFASIVQYCPITDESAGLSYFVYFIFVVFNSPVTVEKHPVYTRVCIPNYLGILNSLLKGERCVRGADAALIRRTVYTCNISSGLAFVNDLSQDNNVETYIYHMSKSSCQVLCVAAKLILLPSRGRTNRSVNLSLATV